MQMDKVKPLFEAFVGAYDQEASKRIWEKQSKQFKNFWESRIMSNGSDL